MWVIQKYKPHLYRACSRFTSAPQLWWFGD
nr:MAG TPA: hypothetical protein [Caudoviricetes sp.]